MADEKEIQDSQEEEESEDSQPSKPSEPSEQPSTPSGLSDDQIASIKSDISKDVSGKVSEQVSKSVIERIGEALGLTKKQEDELPKDQESLQKYLDSKLDEKFKSYEQKQQQQVQQSAEQRQQQVQSIIKGWQSQYDQLARMGKVPEIKNPNDKNDKGLQARRKIITQIGQMIDQLKTQGIDYTPTVSDVLVANPNALSGPPGANLPISGNTNVTEDDESYTYKELHNSTFDQIAAKGLS